MLQEQMRIKAGNGFTDSKREDAYVEDSGHFVMSDSTYTAGAEWFCLQICTTNPTANTMKSCSLR